MDSHDPKPVAIPGNRDQSAYETIDRAHTKGCRTLDKLVKEMEKLGLGLTKGEKKHFDTVSAFLQKWYEDLLKPWALEKYDEHKLWDFDFRWADRMLTALGEADEKGPEAVRAFVSSLMKASSAHGGKSILQLAVQHFIHDVPTKTVI